MQRVPPKQGRYKSRRPEPFCQSPEEEKCERDIGCMEEEVDEMMGPCVQAKKLAIGLMRNPGERMPVAGVKRRESPWEIRPIQSIFYKGIIRDIVRVVEVDEVIPPGRQKHQQRGKCQQQGDKARARHHFL